MSDPADRDDLDGICDFDAPMGPPVPDEWLPWVVLFATDLTPDLGVRDVAVLEAHAAQWRALFSGGPDA